MSRTFNIAIPATLFLSALILSACTSNSEPDAATASTPARTTQPDNNFGRNADAEETATTNATSASATDKTTRQSPTSKKKKSVKKSRKAVKKPEPTQ